MSISQAWKTAVVGLLTVLVFTEMVRCQETTLLGEEADQFQSACHRRDGSPFTTTKPWACVSDVDGSPIVVRREAGSR